MTSQSNRLSKLIYMSPSDIIPHYSDNSSLSEHSTSTADSSSDSCHTPVTTESNSQSPYRIEPRVVNGSIYQTLKRVDTNNSNCQTNYLECIDKLVTEKKHPIYSNKTDLLTRNRSRNYEEPPATINSIKNSVSFRTPRNTNQAILNELLHGSGPLRPVPPSRTSSLQYRNRQLHPSASLFIYKKENGSGASSSGTSSDGDESGCQRQTLHDESIYSFNLGISRLSSFNLGCNKKPPVLSTSLLTKSEQFRLESFYNSIGSTVFACKASADLYTTDLDNLVRLLDWQHQIAGIPVWLFNTGQHPKRPKGLSLVFADPRTAFSNLTITNLSHRNDLKWTKPGHLTLKIFPHNVPSKCQTRQSRTFDSVYANYTGLEAKLALLDNTTGFVFAALRFTSDFECSKFYDFYRELIVDAQNDELFNPNYVKSGQKSSRLSGVAKVFRKIIKSSISSPVAFQHINSLSMVDED